MTIVYNSKHLGAGTIGGRGFWIGRLSEYVQKTWWAFSQFGSYRYPVNTNLVSDRALANAVLYNEELPHIEPTPYGRLDLVTEAAFSGPVYPYTTAFTEISPPDSQDWGWNSVAFTPDPEHELVLAMVNFTGRKSDDNYRVMVCAHKVLYDNPSSILIDDAIRIPIGESGYTDTLPGLFKLTVVRGSIDDTLKTCLVTVSEPDNSVVYWVEDYPGEYTKRGYNGGSLNHPYFRDSDSAITVSFAEDNVNTNIIPGVAISLSSDLGENSYGLVAIGYEFVNSLSEVSDLTIDVDGRMSYFHPVNAYGLVGLGAAVCGETGKGEISRWHIFNVTDEVQTGCTFHIIPLVRLEQDTPQTPFDQWFMGFGASLFPKSQVAYPITFTGLVTGTPNTITLVSNSGLGMLVTEIDPDTYLSTGTTHTDASGLKCDGETLYRWDAAGIYFVLATDVDELSIAAVWVRHGDQIEKRIRLDVVSQPTSYSTITPPTTWEVGGWEGLELGAFSTQGAWVGSNHHYYVNDSVDSAGEVYQCIIEHFASAGDEPGVGPYWADYWILLVPQLVPISPYLEESLFTGKIANQGRDLPFFNSALHPTMQHWYNHDFEVPTYPKLESNYAYDDLGEYCLMITCDNPLYFQVIPITFVPMRTSSSQTVVKGAACIASENPVPVVDITGSLLVVESQSSLAIPIEEHTEEYQNFLAAFGVDFED